MEIIVKDAQIRTMKKSVVDYISVTDIAKQKNAIDPNGVIANWMRNRNTIEFLGIWEMLYNPNLNPSNSKGLEKKQALMHLRCPHLVGSMQQTPSESYHNQEDMEGLTHKQTLLLNLHRGFLLNSDYI